MSTRKTNQASNWREELPREELPREEQEASSLFSVPSFSPDLQDVQFLNSLSTLSPLSSSSQLRFVSEEMGEEFPTDSQDESLNQELSDLDSTAEGGESRSRLPSPFLSEEELREIGPFDFSCFSPLSSASSSQIPSTSSNLEGDSSQLLVTPSFLSSSFQLTNSSQIVNLDFSPEVLSSQDQELNDLLDFSLEMSELRDRVSFLPLSAEELGEIKSFDLAYLSPLSTGSFSESLPAPIPPISLEDDFDFLSSTPGLAVFPQARNVDFSTSQFSSQDLEIGEARASSSSQVRREEEEEVEMEIAGLSQPEGYSPSSNLQVQARSRTQHNLGEKIYRLRRKLERDKRELLAMLSGNELNIYNTWLEEFDSDEMQSANSFLSFLSSLSSISIDPIDVVSIESLMKKELEQKREISFSIEGKKEIKKRVNKEFRVKESKKKDLLREICPDQILDHKEKRAKIVKAIALKSNLSTLNKHLQRKKEMKLETRMLKQEKAKKTSSSLLESHFSSGYSLKERQSLAYKKYKLKRKLETSQKELEDLLSSKEQLAYKEWLAAEEIESSDLPPLSPLSSHSESEDLLVFEKREKKKEKIKRLSHLKADLSKLRDCLQKQEEMSLCRLRKRYGQRALDQQGDISPKKRREDLTDASTSLSTSWEGMPSSSNDEEEGRKKEEARLKRGREKRAAIEEMQQLNNEIFRLSQSTILDDPSISQEEYLRLRSIQNSAKYRLMQRKISLSIFCKEKQDPFTPQEKKYLKAQFIKKRGCLDPYLLERKQWLDEEDEKKKKRELGRREKNDIEKGKEGKELDREESNSSEESES